MATPPQGISRISTPIVLDQWIQCAFEWDDYEAAVKLGAAHPASRAVPGPGRRGHRPGHGLPVREVRVPECVQHSRRSGHGPDHRKHLLPSETGHDGNACPR
jgi:hypothetical protein